VALAAPSNLCVWDAARQRFISDPPPSAGPALRTELADVDIASQPAPAAISALASLSHTEIAIDWSLLRRAGFDVDKPIALKAAHITLAAALRRLLDDFTYPGGLLLFRPERTSITVSTRGVGLCRIYDLGDAAVTRVPPPHPQQAGPGDADETQPDVMDTWSSLIVENVDPVGWSAVDRSYGYISPFGHKIVVNQTWENQEAIESMLTDLLRNPAKRPATQPAGR
jgi:hypothetical protein